MRARSNSLDFTPLKNVTYTPSHKDRDNGVHAYFEENSYWTPSAALGQKSYWTPRAAFEQLKHHLFSSRNWISNAKQEYVYQPLDLSHREIRLFKVVLDSSGWVTGSLEHYEIDNAPPFVALSYLWGSGSFDQAIVVDGGTLTVRSNLRAFLEVYAARHVGDYIWIDQICIDQRTTTERNHQVQLMASIYKAATTVMLWLTSNTDAPVCSRACSFSHFRETPFSDCPWIDNLIRNDYWQRTWIIQELLLAQAIVVYYDRAILTWSQLQTIVGNDHGVAVSDQLNWLRNTALTSTKKEKYHDIAEIVAKSCTSGCSDSRDKLYALQGLLKPSSRVSIDYTKSVLDVFLDGAEMIIRHGSRGWVRHGCIAKLACAMGLVTTTSPKISWIMAEVRAINSHTKRFTVRQQIAERTRLHGPLVEFPRPLSIEDCFEFRNALRDAVTASADSAWPRLASTVFLSGYVSMYGLAFEEEAILNNWVEPVWLAASRGLPYP